jgi:transposase-like protein
MGRPAAVTPELAEAGQQMLRDGVTVEQLCTRLGVARSSWYRYVHRDGAAVRPYRVAKRRANSISPALERRMMVLDKQGLPRVAIAERLRLHINTVVKYLLRAGRPRRR